MFAFDRIVEQRLQQAEERGVFRDLPGSGRPLRLEDVSGVPADLRASYLMLKSNGFLPPELEAKKHWLQLRDLLACCIEPGARAELGRRVEHARTRYRELIAARAPRYAMFDAVTRADS